MGGPRKYHYEPSLFSRDGGAAFKVRGAVANGRNSARSEFAPKPISQIQAHNSRNSDSAPQEKVKLHLKNSKKIIKVKKILLLLLGELLQIKVLDKNL